MSLKQVLESWMMVLESLCRLLVYLLASVLGAVVLAPVVVSVALTIYAISVVAMVFVAVLCAAFPGDFQCWLKQRGSI